MSICEGNDEAFTVIEATMVGRRSPCPTCLFRRDENLKLPPTIWAHRTRPDACCIHSLAPQYLNPCDLCVASLSLPPFGSTHRGSARFPMQSVRDFYYMIEFDSGEDNYNAGQHGSHRSFDARTR
jgi:hypothetical protein